jgi:hypothetical protein
LRDDRLNAYVSDQEGRTRTCAPTIMRYCRCFISRTYLEGLPASLDADDDFAFAPRACVGDDERIRAVCWR